MKLLNKAVSVLMVVVMMFSLMTFNSSAASVKKMEIVSLPTKTTFYKGTDWNYGHWTFPEDEGLGTFTPDDSNITFMHQGGYIHNYQDRGLLDMNGLVVKVTYSDGTTKNVTYKETVLSSGVLVRNVMASPKGGEYSLGENTIEIYFESSPSVYTTYKINIVDSAPVTKGDVNSDSKVNSSDALLVLQHSVESIKLTADQITRADMNGDKKINSHDALMILQKSVGLK